MSGGALEGWGGHRERLLAEWLGGVGGQLDCAGLQRSGWEAAGRLCPSPQSSRAASCAACAARLWSSALPTKLTLCRAQGGYDLIRYNVTRVCDGYLTQECLQVGQHAAPTCLGS
jgi:hypothetical protein